MNKFHQISLALAFTCLASLPLKAQTSQGILSGVARDTKSVPSSPRPRSPSLTKSTGEIRTSATKGDGTYRLDAVPPGRYTVTIEESRLRHQKGYRCRRQRFDG